VLKLDVEAIAASSAPEDLRDCRARGATAVFYFLRRDVAREGVLLWTTGRVDCDFLPMIPHIFSGDRVMKALLNFIFRARRPHDDRLRANHFDAPLTFSPYIVMLPGAQG
jgi:hypothetical protein